MRPKQGLIPENADKYHVGMSSWIYVGRVPRSNYGENGKVQSSNTHTSTGRVGEQDRESEDAIQAVPLLEAGQHSPTGYQV